jgi:hypothetical protein
MKMYLLGQLFILEICNLEMMVVICPLGNWVLGVDLGLCFIKYMYEISGFRVEFCRLAPTE